MSIHRVDARMHNNSRMKPWKHAANRPISAPDAFYGWMSNQKSDIWPPSIKKSPKAIFPPNRSSARLSKSSLRFLTNTSMPIFQSVAESAYYAKMRKAVRRLHFKGALAEHPFCIIFYTTICLPNNRHWRRSALSV